MADTTLSAPHAQDMAARSNLHLQAVTWVHHWTQGLFSFRIERPASFRFRSGEFVMIGLPGNNDRPLMRAYSIVSPSWEDHLEFFSVKVPDGPLTSALQHLEVGDHVFLGRKPTGTLVIDALKPGTHLAMIATGTGLAPFLSVLRDPETYDKFERIIVTHTVRRSEELAYRQFLEEEIRHDPVFSDMLRDRLIYYPTVTQGPFHRSGRITDRMSNGAFYDDLDLGQARESNQIRTMVCGSIAFTKEIAGILMADSRVEGSNVTPGDFVIERAFVG